MAEAPAYAEKGREINERRREKICDVLRNYASTSPRNPRLLYMLYSP